MINQEGGSILVEDVVFSVLLNGSPGDTFKSSRGLHQGDPLSPMIFILVAEVLARMFLKAQEVGLIHGFKVSKEGISLPILQFTDDTLICMEGDLEEAWKVRNIFLWFEAYSGLRVNTGKKVIYQVNLVDNWDSISRHWRCKVGAFMNFYLGLPLGAKFRGVATWDPLFDRIRIWLAMWRRRYLSRGVG